MSPAAPSRASRPGSAAAGDDLFDALSYGEWVRRTIAACAARPDAAVLFDSTIAEPTAELAQVIRRAFADEVTDRYVSAFAGGNPFALSALAARYGVAEDQIIPTTGATSGLAMTLAALVRPGDLVLVETPGFDLLARLAEAGGADVGLVQRPAPGFQVDLADLEARLTLRTRVVLLTNLHNPSGVQTSETTLRAVARACARVGAVLVVDEVYGDVLRPAPAIPAAALGDNVVSVSSLTKVFGLFALKFGWVVAAPELAERIRRAAPEGDVGVSKLTHAIAAHVLQEPAPFDAHWADLLTVTRPIVQRAAAAMIADGLLAGEVPDHGCMYFPRVVGVEDTLALARDLWRDFGVLVAPGEFFGLAGHIRIGFGADAAATGSGLARLHAALSALRPAA